MYFINAMGTIFGACCLHVVVRLINALLSALHGGLTQFKQACKALQDLTEEARRHNETSVKNRAAQLDATNPLLLQELQLLKVKLRDVEAENTVLTAWSKSQADTYNENVRELTSALKNSQAFNLQLTSLTEALEKKRTVPESQTLLRKVTDHDVQDRITTLEAEIQTLHSEIRTVVAKAKEAGHMKISQQQEIQDLRQALQGVADKQKDAQRTAERERSGRDLAMLKMRETAEGHLSLAIKLKATENEIRRIVEEYARTGTELKALQSTTNNMTEHYDFQIATLRRTITRLRSRSKPSRTDSKAIWGQVSNLKQEITRLKQKWNVEDMVTAMSDLCQAFSTFTLTPKTFPVPNSVILEVPFMEPGGPATAGKGAPATTAPTESIVPVMVYCPPKSVSQGGTPKSPTSSVEQETRAPTAEDLVMKEVEWEREPSQAETVIEAKLGKGLSPTSGLVFKPEPLESFQPENAVLFGLPRQGPPEFLFGSTNIDNDVATPTKGPGQVPTIAAASPDILSAATVVRAPFLFHPKDPEKADKRSGEETTEDANMLSSKIAVSTITSSSPRRDRKLSAGLPATTQTAEVQLWRPLAPKPREKLSKYSSAQLEKMKREASEAPKPTHYSSAYLEGLRDHMLRDEVLVALAEDVYADDEWLEELRHRNAQIEERALVDLSEETRHALSPYTEKMLCDMMEVFCERFVWVEMAEIYSDPDDMDEEVVREKYMDFVAIYLRENLPDSLVR